MFSQMYEVVPVQRHVSLRHCDHSHVKCPNKVQNVYNSTHYDLLSSAYDNPILIQV